MDRRSEWNRIIIGTKINLSQVLLRVEIRAVILLSASVFKFSLPNIRHTALSTVELFN